MAVAHEGLSGEKVPVVTVALTPREAQAVRRALDLTIGIFAPHLESRGTEVSGTALVAARTALMTAAAQAGVEVEALLPVA